MQATVVVERHTSEGAFVRIVDKDADGGLSPELELRFGSKSLAEDQAFLEGRAPTRLPDAGSFVTFAKIDVTIENGKPVLVAGPLADLGSVGNPAVHWLGWADIRDFLAQSAAQDQPDEGILYVDAGGTAFVILSRGPYFHAFHGDEPRTPRELSFDGKPIPTETGFHFFAGESWSVVDRQALEAEHNWGFTVQRVEPLTVAHMPSFGRSSLEGLSRLAASTNKHPSATPVGRSPSI